MSFFGDVIRQANSPDSGPSGIGGTADVIWHCDETTTDQILELSTVDFSVVRQANAPHDVPSGIGGDADTIWHCDAQYKAAIYELSTVDFSVVRRVDSTSLWPKGIGGTADTIWHCGFTLGKIYELSTVDLSVVRNADAPDIKPSGIGGDDDTIWHCNAWVDQIYKLSIVDFSVEKWLASPDIRPDGIGGDTDTIWLCDNTPTDQVYELATDFPFSYTGLIEVFAMGPDAAWTDYDLFMNHAVPKGAIAEIVCANKNTGLARTAGVRTDGSGIERKIDLHEAEGDGVTTVTMFVKCHATTGLIECYSEIGADVDFYLVGYFHGTIDFDFTEKFESIGQPGVAWAEKDLTAYGVPDDAVVQILMGNEADDTDYFAGVRNTLSALERGYTLDEAEADGLSTLSMVVQSDADAVIDWKAGSATDVTMWLLGWFSPNIIFTGGFTDYSPADDEVWESKTIIEADALSIVVFAIMHEDSGSNTFCGLRVEGGAIARMIEEHEAEGGSSTGFQASIKVDADMKCEVYCQDASEAQYAYTGFFTISAGPVPTGWPHILYGVPNANIGTIMGISLANINAVMGVA